MVHFKVLNHGVLNGCISTGKEAAGIRCPTPYLLRLHVLVMEFIGKAGWAAPRLKDAAISLDKLQEGYVEMIVAMRTLYQKCKLVHGDLSKYNILYYEGHLYIIDVSQAVDLDHPQALDFLCEDCVHVSEFFKKHGVAVMTIRELFDFIVDPTIADVAVDSYLEEVQQRILATGDMTPEDQITDSLFVQSYIPKMLEQVKNVEDDAFWMTSGKDTKDMYYQTVTGLKQALTLSQTAGAQKDQLNGFNEFKGTIEPDDHSSSDSGESESGTDEDGSSSEAEVPWASLDKKAARKENKKKVKEEERSQKEQNSKGCKEKKEEIGKSSQNQVSNPSDKGKVL